MATPAQFSVVRLASCPRSRPLASIPDTLPNADYDAQGNLVAEVRPTVTIQEMDTLTNDTGVVVEPASANIYQNPTTNQYVDADITAKQVSITVPGTAFNRTDNRYIEIKQGDTIRKAKTLISGSAVTEDYWNQQTTMTFTEDFSGYTKDVDAVVSIYLTDTATKPVATATINVVEMPFKLVFFKTDHLGTPRMVTDHDGTILTTHDFLAYGEELTDPDFNTNRMKFTGHERDPETGLDYMKARYYGAGVGRFLQVDPFDLVLLLNQARTKEERQKLASQLANPMLWNRYTYCFDNPVNYVDPDGEAAIGVGCLVVGGVIVVGVSAWVVYEIVTHYRDAYDAREKAEELWNQEIEPYLNGTSGEGPEDAQEAEIIIDDLQLGIISTASDLLYDLHELGIAGNYGPGTPNPIDIKTVLTVVKQALEEISEKLNREDVNARERSQLENAKRRAEALLEKARRKEKNGS